MAELNLHKVTAAPTTYAANDLFFITAANSEHIEIYLANKTGDGIRRLPNESDIAGMISTALSTFASSKLVGDIAERDAITELKDGMVVLVVDAAADSTVNLGSATYGYDLDNDEWIKIAEFESNDVTLEWSAIQNGPSSTPTAIDDAVLNSHTHANATELAKIGQDAAGNVTYDGNPIKPSWVDEAW